MPSIPSDIAIGLTAIAALVSGWLQEDGLAPWLNALIAALAFLAEVSCALWLISGFSGSLKDVTLEFIALAVLLSGNELKSLIDYVKGAQSPLAPKPVLTPPLVRRATAAYMPDNNTTGK